MLWNGDGKRAALGHLEDLMEAVWGQDAYTMFEIAMVSVSVITVLHCSELR